MPDQFFLLPSPFPDYPGQLYLLEPTGSASGMLRQQLLDGTYDKPFVLEHQGVRSLLFSLTFIQSSMRIDAPDALDLEYTQHMMAFVLFHTNVRHLLLLGLGGGSLAKFCRRRLPSVTVTAVEADPRVVLFRELFGLAPDDANFTTQVADAFDHVATTRDEFDVILVDAFDGGGIAPTVDSEDFYRLARHRLTAKGVLVANLAGEPTERRTHFERLRQAFGDTLLLISVDGGCNHLAFAFRDTRFEPRWKWIHSQARALTSRYGLDFVAMATRLERCWQRGWESCLP